MNAESILAQHGGLVRSIIRHAVSDPQAHDDLFQDVCVRVIENINLLRDSNTAPAWIATITRRTVINAYRKRKRCVINSDTLDEIAVYPRKPSGVVSAFNRLSMADREILLTFAAETPLEDYAKAKGIPYGTAKSRAWAARQRFRKELER